MFNPQITLSGEDLVKLFNVNILNKEQIHRLLGLESGIEINLPE